MIMAIVSLNKKWRVHKSDQYLIMRCAAESMPRNRYKCIMMVIMVIAF